MLIIRRKPARSIVTLAQTAARGGARPEGASRVTAARTVASLRTPFERFVPRGAIVLSILTFGSYVMGLVRDRILTQTYGLEDGQLDTFNAAFQIPELLFSVIVASGLAAPFIPIFTNLERDDGTEAAYRFGQTILTMALGAMTIVAAILFVLAPLTVSIAAPGFDQESQDLYVELFRLSCISQILFAGSMALGEVLVVRRRFVFYGAAPLFYNLGIVVGTLLLADRIGIQAAAVGAILGAAAHAGVRLIGVRFRTTFRPRLRLETADGVDPRVLPADDPQDRVEPDRADHLPVLHERRVHARGREHHDGRASPGTSRACPSASSGWPSRSPPSRGWPRPTPRAIDAGSSARSARPG